MTSRREFVERAALSALGLALPIPPITGVTHAASAPPVPRSRHQGGGVVDVHRAPDLVLAQTAAGQQRLRRAGERWTGENGVIVTTTEQPDALHVALSAPGVAVSRLYLRWRGAMTTTRLILGDAWERAYGNLEWRGWVPDRVMPWYAAAYDGSRTHGYGVRTGARAFCYWQLDPDGISLCADVRSGSMGVELGDRTLDVCDVVSRAGQADESPFAALHAFCAQMCPAPRLPSRPVYGSNDWYWAYGRNSAETVRADANHLVDLSPTGENRPLVVIDDGWEPGRGEQKEGAGTWDRGNEKFPDMPGLVADIRGIGARAGIWIRPLQAPAAAPDSWRLSREHSVLDPTVPEVRKKVADDIARLRAWGFDLIKHDYTTFDILGRWGYQMGSALTRGQWSFAAGRAHTTGEVIGELYDTIRTAAGDALIIGCNTVSHLSAGRFELCRVGDDTSGTDWARTRKMGVNSLAFRGAQDGAFYVTDADCAAVTTSVPWSFGRQWLDLLAHSGTTLFVSLAPDALGAEQRRDLRAALALAAASQPLAEPLDWQRTVYPGQWRLGGEKRRFDWVGEDGVGLP
ncbi:MAG TPA: hypothetical protein VFW98_01460 [Gemmatimonadaceae bacterium]|nr:hypothetical protein [Gemmatimonadaceae bacterium]